MEEIQRRVAAIVTTLEAHTGDIGRLQGQFGIIIALQIAQVSALVAILVKVFVK